MLNLLALAITVTDDRMQSKSSEYKRNIIFMKPSILTVFLIAASLFMQAAYAEDGCPAGMQPYQPVQGFGAPQWSCMPIPGYDSGSNSNNSLPPPPPPKPWHSRYGAVAVDWSTNTLGVAVNLSNKSETEATAIADCKAKGGKKCKIVIAAYGNTCVALSTGKEGHDVEFDNISEAAELKSMDGCMKAEGTPCKLLYSGCSLPVQY